jgi:hypothetical protein
MPGEVARGKPAQRQDLQRDADRNHDGGISANGSRVIAPVEGVTCSSCSGPGGSQDSEDHRGEQLDQGSVRCT